MCVVSFPFDLLTNWVASFAVCDACVLLLYFYSFVLIAVRPLFVLLKKRDREGRKGSLLVLPVCIFLEGGVGGYVTTLGDNQS